MVSSGRAQGRQLFVAPFSNLLAALLLPSLLILVPLQSRAMDTKVEGETVVMSGSVVASDCTTLGEILSRSKIKLVVLTNSSGGNANAGYCVGDLIRERGLSTAIRGRCASSCSRMWLGGVDRTLEGPNSKVGLHGNYGGGGVLLADAPQRLRAWIPRRAPDVDKTLMEQWIHLPSNKWMMYFYNDKAELCEGGACTAVNGRNARNAGLSTR
jgi:hypothetical protein